MHESLTSPVIHGILGRHFLANLFLSPDAIWSKNLQGVLSMLLRTVREGCTSVKRGEYTEYTKVIYHNQVHKGHCRKQVHGANPGEFHSTIAARMFR